MRFAAAREPGDTALLLGATDALIDAKEGAPAAALWRAMGYAAPVYARIAPGGGRL